MPDVDASPRGQPRDPVAWRAPRACLAFVLALTGAATTLAGENPHEHAVPAAKQPFLAENEAAMARMMDGMAIESTGDIDRDFVAMMSAHHQGAIDMAVALLRHGSNARLRRLAQEIIVTQQQEIAAMHLAIGAALPPPAAAPTQAMPAHAPATRSDQ